MKLSIIIPVYNEEKTLYKLIEQVKAVQLDNIEKEIIVVDDCSLDNSFDILKGITGIKLIHHIKNKGKSAALRTGFKYATGDLIIIQDADLEYDPNDYGQLIKPILDSEADVVYGSRFYTSKEFNKLKQIIITRNQKVLRSFLFLMGNKVLTTATSLLYGQKITDMETCYKVFKMGIIRNIQLKEERFGFEPEITAKVLKKGHKIYEVPISYNPRNLDEGKKITVKDGLKALWYLVKYKFIN